MSEFINSFLGCIVGLVIFSAILILLAWLSAYLTSKNVQKITEYQQAKERIVSALKRSIEAQNSSHLDRIDAGYHDLDAALPRNAGPQFNKLLNALYFWDCWIDAYNHDWRQYGGRQAEDWLRLARLIVADLEADLEITHHIENLS